MVRDKQIRQLLLKFAEIKGRQAAGLKEEDYQSLCAKLQGADADQEQLILPLVQYHPVITQVEEGGQLRRVFSSCKKHQPILFSLGTSAPAVQLLRISSVQVLAPVIAGQSVVTLQQLEELRLGNPTLHGLLKHHLGTHLPDMYTSLLKGLEAVARRGLVPAARSVQQQLRARSQQQQRLRQQAAGAGPGAVAAVVTASGRLPVQWSQDEAMYRTGCFMGFSQQWSPSELGGSDVIRPLRLYAADTGTSMGTDSTCTKHKRSTIQLAPGIILFWCGKCWKCRGFALMRDAESPRTVFEVLYTRCPNPPVRFTYDNDCNEHHYILNREPEFFANTNFFIDEPHYMVCTFRFGIVFRVAHYY